MAWIGALGPWITLSRIRPLNQHDGAVRACPVRRTGTSERGSCGCRDASAQRRRVSRSRFRCRAIAPGGRQARRGPTRGHVLEAHGQRPRPRPETDDDRHLHDRSRGLRRHDAPDSGSLVRGEHLGEVTDLGPDAVRRPADGLPQRPRARQYLHDHLGELPGQRDGLARSPARRRGPSSGRGAGLRSAGLGAGRLRGAAARAVRRSRSLAADVRVGCASRATGTRRRGSRSRTAASPRGP